MLSSLKCWRSGWKIGGRKLACLTIGGQEYNIYAFAQISPWNKDEIKASVYLLNGAYIGLMLPISAQEQWNNNQIWDVVDGPNGQIGYWGGHAMYAVGYDSEGIIFVTWGKKQKSTWSWFLKYCDEAYAICDDRDAFLGDTSPLDIEKLDGYLKEITK